MSDITTVRGTYNREAVGVIADFWRTSTQLPTLFALASVIQESGGIRDLNVERHTEVEDSYGMLQINIRAGHRDPRTGAPVNSDAAGRLFLGLDGLKRGFELMAPRWIQAFANTGSWDRFLVAPIAQLAEWAPAAQGSVDWGMDLATTRWADAWLLWDVYRDWELAHTGGTGVDRARQQIQQAAGLVLRAATRGLDGVTQPDDAWRAVEDAVQQGRRIMGVK